MELFTVLQNYISSNRGATLTLEMALHEDRRDHAKFRASDAGKCQLMRYWKRQGKPAGKEIPGDIRLLFEVGNLIHAWIIRALKDMQYLLFAEMELEDEHRIGHFDALVRDDSGAITLYDFKTVSGKSFYYRNQNKSADRQHALQLLTYDDMSRFSIDAHKIAYINRETFQAVVSVK